MFFKKAKRIKKLEELLWQKIAEQRDYKEAQEIIHKTQNAYIAVLLKKLGATSKDKAVSITNEEITTAMAKCETKGDVPDIGVWSLYCEEVISD